MHDSSGIALCEIAASTSVEIPAVYPAPWGGLGPFSSASSSERILSEAYLLVSKFQLLNLYCGVLYYTVLIFVLTNRDCYVGK